MERLVKEQLLDKDIVFEMVGKPVKEVIRFGYDRFASHIITARLLALHVNPQKPAHAFSVGQPLGLLVEAGTSGFADRSLLEALLIQFPERYGMELLRILGTAHDDGQTAAAFLRTLPWRRPETITEDTQRVLDDVVGFIPGLRHEWMVTLFQLATRPGHALNALYFHDKLTALSLVERDMFYVPLFHRLSKPTEFDQTGVVSRLITWALESPGAAIADRETAELAAIVLGWIFIVTIRPLRDRATKAMVRLLQDQFTRNGRCPWTVRVSERSLRSRTAGGRGLWLQC